MGEAVLTRTFPVSRVSLATEPLPEVAYPQAVAKFLCGPIESCSKYHGKLVGNVYSHPLIAALHGAYCGHRPVCLSPDIIWLTITQGLARHINENAERLRRQFVTHDGKLTIQVRRDDFVKGSPENPWVEVFTEFSEEIRNHAGPAYELIVADFSTTGPVERAASEVVLLDSMQSFFNYELNTACGIPSITLEGTEDDWRLLASRAAKFSELGLEWWTRHLLPILDEFAAAAGGKVRRRFWRSIYKYHGPRGSGSPHVSGWITDLFPYLRRQVNPWLGARSWRKGPMRDDFPNTPGTAPYKWIVLGIPHEMEFIGGLLGVAQDAETLALRPEIGWAIREVGQKQPMYGMQQHHDFRQGEPL